MTVLVCLCSLAHSCVANKRTYRPIIQIIDSFAGHEVEITLTVALVATLVGLVVGYIVYRCDK